VNGGPADGCIVNGRGCLYACRSGVGRKIVGLSVGQSVVVSVIVEGHVRIAENEFIDIAP
jgi:Na+-translocating ferredoxin:NAD+ oxidoreductase RnfE subunit